MTIWGVTERHVGTGPVETNAMIKQRANKVSIYDNASGKVPGDGYQSDTGPQTADTTSISSEEFALFFKHSS